MITSNQPKMSGPGVPLPTKIMVDSHDTKPTNVKNGARLKEIDTGKEFIYNEGTSSWDEQPSNGGGGGFVGLYYEEGEFTPEEDTPNPVIHFANENGKRPIYVVVIDVTQSKAPASSITDFALINYIDLYGAPTETGTLARTRVGYWGSSSYTAGGASITTLEGETTASMGYYLTDKQCVPYNSATRLYRTGRTYKWLAVWAPDSANDDVEQGDER